MNNANIVVDRRTRDRRISFFEQQPPVVLWPMFLPKVMVMIVIDGMIGRYFALVSQVASNYFVALDVMWGFNPFILKSERHYDPRPLSERRIKERRGVWA